MPLLEENGVHDIRVKIHAAAVRHLADFGFPTSTTKVWSLRGPLLHFFR